MINDKIYLFNKLKNILDEKNIDLEIFSRVYDEASLSSKPKINNSSIFTEKNFPYKKYKEYFRIHFTPLNI